MIETFIFVNIRDVLCFTSSDEILSWQRLSPVFFTKPKAGSCHLLVCRGKPLRIFDPLFSVV